MIHSDCWQVHAEAVPRLRLPPGHGGRAALPRHGPRHRLPQQTRRRHPRQGAGIVHNCDHFRAVNELCEVAQCPQKAFPHCTVLSAGVPDVAGRAERVGGELRRAEELPRAELRRGAGRRHRQAQAPPRPLLAPGRGRVI